MFFDVLFEVAQIKYVCGFSIREIRYYSRYEGVVIRYKGKKEENFWGSVGDYLLTGNCGVSMGSKVLSYPHKLQFV